MGLVLPLRRCLAIIFLKQALPEDHGVSSSFQKRLALSPGTTLALASISHSREEKVSSGVRQSEEGSSLSLQVCLLPLGAKKKGRKVSVCEPLLPKTTDDVLVTSPWGGSCRTSRSFLQGQRKGLKVPYVTFWELTSTTIYLCMNSTNII